jgi:hypothetical protein
MGLGYPRNRQRPGIAETIIDRVSNGDLGLAGGKVDPLACSAAVPVPG